jgi:hypothetical protein
VRAGLKLLIPSELADAIERCRRCREVIGEKPVRFVVGGKPATGTVERPQNGLADVGREILAQEAQCLPDVEGGEGRGGERSLVGVGFIETSVGILDPGPEPQAFPNPFQQSGVTVLAVTGPSVR